MQPAVTFCCWKATMSMTFYKLAVLAAARPQIVGQLQILAV